MKNVVAEIKTNKQIADGIYEMVLCLPAKVLPGQFINIRLEGHYLRRPISICDWTEDTLTIIYKKVGEGTEQMSRMQAGEKLDILYPLGNGYDLSQFPTYERPLLIGGGVGVPPLYGLCKELIKKGIKPIAILGFKSDAEVFYKDRFAELDAQVIVTTEDGSEGIKGFVTDIIEEMQSGSEGDFDYIFACGPEAMLKAVDRGAPAEIPGQFSFERRMGCGFGACMGCSCRTKYGSKRICIDGPVLERGEIIW